LTVVDIRRYGARALLVTPAGLARHVDHPDVVEVVPGAATVLVVVRDPTRLDAVRDTIVALERDAVRAGSVDGLDRDVVLDVVYDGEDLADISAAAGLPIEDVIALHSGAVYHCDFCGFAPGFAYLSGLDPRLHMPRRATPRPSVSAGSVAIAGPYSAVYPSASPGGWHLLGRTDAMLWDLDADPPALITPGTAVRFRPVERTSRPYSRNSGVRPTSSAGSPVLRVVSAGVATSFQDRGRAGYGHLAVPGSGAVDRHSADLVNRLVGNPPDAASLETAGGLVLEVTAPALVADSATGAVDTLGAGQTLKVNPAAGEQWAYLAVRGGFEAGPVLGSRSWDSLSRLGPPPLQPGDLLGTGQEPATPVATEQAPHPSSEQATVVRVREGPRADWFVPEALDVLTSADWTVTSTSRVGARLGGPGLLRTNSAELPSEGLVVGAIQVPPDGKPVALLADHPTTGGYPVIAVVEEADLGRLAQRPPGSIVRFRAY
jgi:KipI family sensor histidine kinase inhibitor